MNSGGAYYNTAVKLRSEAQEANEILQRVGDDDVVLACVMTARWIGFEIAAAICCVAQAIDDHAEKGLFATVRP